VENDDKALVFLRDASNRTLEAYELAKRNEAALLSKELRQLVHKITDCLSEAELARKIREMRPQIMSTRELPNSILFDAEEL
jgi:hypothetical protein